MEIFSVEDFAKEFWTRTLFETLELDSDTKYVVRGVIQSILHDMKQAHNDGETNE